MNQGLPKSALDAIAKQTPPDDHPSADLLSGYVEHELTTAEKDKVEIHLAVCVQCREVVFLAGSAVEEPLVNVASAPASSQPQAAARWSWNWAVPVAAGVALIFGLLVERRDTANIFLRSPSQAETRMPVNRTPAEEAGSRAFSVQSSPSPPVDGFNKPGAVIAGPPATRSKPAAEGTAQPDKLARSKSGANPASPGNVPGLAAPAPTAPNDDVASQSPLVVAPGDALQNALARQTAAGALGRSSFASSNDEASLLFKTTPPARTHWRVTSDGHVEHSLSSDVWVRALSNEPATFRAVSAVGKTVWAGGDAGVLFHSFDGGAHWNKVVVAADGQAEHATITAIHFSTALQGAVETESGTEWTTTDGGQTWARQ